MCKLKNILYIAIIFIVAFVMTACNKDDKVIGSWYDDYMNEIYFSEDGDCSIRGQYGTYEVDGDNVRAIGTLLDETYFYTNYEYECLTDSAGREYYRYDRALEASEEREAAADDRLNATIESVRSYIPGTWKSGSTTAEFYDDGTFEIVEDAFQWDYRQHKGTWSFDHADGYSGEEMWSINVTWVSENYDEPEEYTDNNVFCLWDWDIDNPGTAIIFGNDRFEKNQ